MKPAYGLVLMCLLAGCGVESAGTAATVANLKAKDAEQAQQKKEQVVKQIEGLQQQADQRLKDNAEK